MANHPSALKRHRQSLKRRARNRNAKAEIRTLTKSVVEAKDNKSTLAKTLQSKIAKAAKKGTLHERNASKKISKLMRSLKKAA